MAAILSRGRWVNSAVISANLWPPGENQVALSLIVIQVTWGGGHLGGLFVFILHQVAISILTHWGRVMHICVSKLTIIGSDNGLSPGRRQAIIWTNAGILLIWALETTFSEIVIEIQTFFIEEKAFEKVVCEKAAILSLPQRVKTVLTDSPVALLSKTDYRETSNIRRTKHQNLNISRFVLQLSLPNPLKPGVKSRMKM